MDEQELTEWSEQRIGRVLSGKWRLDRLIGVGGMAAVYAATHRNGASSAIKLLHPNVAIHAEIRERFLREAYIANKVEHPGAVKVLDDDECGGEPYLVMELLVGESVDARVTRNGGRLSLRDSLLIVEQALAALEVAHHAGVVHRDLKPDNLFVTTGGQVKVLDFGIARLLEGTEMASRTRTGALMGTPGFMAPEQALGRWSDVDGRTDLWSVGAILYTLLTGHLVHHAETANEVIVNAATRPAPSLGAALDAPLEAVRLVDRALEYDRDRRFADARAMRIAIREVLKSVPPDAMGIQPLLSRGAPAAAIGGGFAGNAATVQLQPEQAPERAFDQRLATDEVLEGDHASADQVRVLEGFFASLEGALHAVQQYGREHPQAAGRFARAIAQAVSVLAESDTALVWNVTPYAFVAGERSVWEPRPPFDRIAYQLFADGLRSMGILPGLGEVELKALLEILTLDRENELSPEDDFVTLLWDAHIEHVLYRAIDSFAEGEQDERAAFEQRTAEIVALAQFDSGYQLEECWQEGRKAEFSDDKDRATRILAAAASGFDAGAAAQVANLEQVGGPDASALAALAVEPATRAALEAALSGDTQATGERFVTALAAAYREAVREREPSAVAGPLNTALEALCPHKPGMAVEFLLSLCRALGNARDPNEAELLRSELVSQALSVRAMQSLLNSAAEAKEQQAELAAALSGLFPYLDATHVPAALAVLTRLEDSPLGELLLDYVARSGAGHEAEMGAMFAEADVELGLALIRVLARIGSSEARAEIGRAATNQHPVVRIEALGHVEGVSSERLRLELRNLLEDQDPEVRLQALRAILRHKIRVAGPFLVLRIRSPDFDKLSYEERQLALAALAELAAQRAESVCLELLKEGRVMSSDAHEETRALAAHTLGEIASTRDSLAALEEAATARWRNSERVRETAGSAHHAALSRLSRPPRKGGP